MNTRTSKVSVIKQDKNKPYQCDECEQCFSRPSRLRIHKYNHTGEKPFICQYPDCNKTYSNQSHLKRHENITHLNKINEDAVMCDAAGCGRLLANKYSLVKHKKRYHDKDNARFSCNDCDKSYNTKTLLDSHSLIHGKEAPYTCDHCGIKFIQFHLHQKHMRNHKIYKCECEETFARYLWLLDHKRSNCPVKRQKQSNDNHVCNVCKMEFSSAKNLAAHGTVHRTDAKSFECPYPNCKNSYKYSRNLRWHIKTVHEQLFPIVHCSKENCNAIFKSNRNLKNHLINLHSDLPKIKKTRKVRKDKGISKTNLVLKLSGLEAFSKTGYLNREFQQLEKEGNVDKEIENNNAQLNVATIEM